MSKTQMYSVTTNKFTCGIEVNNGIVVKASPILGSFKDKSVARLMDWLDDKFTDEYKIEKVV